MAATAFVNVAIGNVAVATDFSPFTERALLHGLATASHFGAVLHLLHCVRLSDYVLCPDVFPQATELAHRDASQLIHRLKREHKLDGIEYRGWVIEGEVEDTLPKFVCAHHVDLLITGTHGRHGISKLLLGSVAQKIVRSALCPVLTVGPYSPGSGPELQLKRVLLAVDQSTECWMAISYALTAAREMHAALTILQVLPAQRLNAAETDDALRSHIWTLLGGAEALPQTTQYRTMCGDPAKAILACASDEHCDLIVLGPSPSVPASAHTISRETYRIMSEAICPVLTVPGRQIVMTTNTS